MEHAAHEDDTPKTWTDAVLHVLDDKCEMQLDRICELVEEFWPDFVTRDGNWRNLVRKALDDLVEDGAVRHFLPAGERWRQSSWDE
jgi:hypothetical protein